MVITWYGLSCFRISSGELALVTDPFSKSTGLTAPRFRADIIISSNFADSAYNNLESLSGESQFMIDGPGEFDIKGLFVQGIAARGESKNNANGFDYTTIYVIRMEDMRLGFLGCLKQKELTVSQLESLGEIDILFVPVGGKTVCDAESAVTIVNQIEPRIVIPMHFTQKGLRSNLDKVDLFLKEIGQGKAVPEDKLTLKKSALSELKDTIQVVVLNPQR